MLANKGLKGLFSYVLIVFSKLFGGFAPEIGGVFEV